MTAMSTREVDALDLTDPAHYRRGFPHALFTELRALGAVHRHHPVMLPRYPEPLGFWSVVRHAEIQQVNRDWQTFSAQEGSAVPPTEPERQRHMIVSMDPPDHTRLRRLISAGFTPRMISQLEAHVIRRASQILDEAGARGDCEFVGDVAYQLPMHVIADIVGIPEPDRPWVFARTDVLLRSLDPSTALTADDRLAAERDLFEYAEQLGRQKRDHPSDDIWSLLAVAEIAGDDGAPTELSELELDMFFVILALAGSETTRNAISQGLMALVAHPDQLDALRTDPALLSTATDEMIRWASPVLLFGRSATRDVELGGVSIAAGDRVVLWYPSGNRDERAFPDPFRFDVRRQPNPHVSFGGGGPHYCLGANLAKMEVQVMFRSLLARYDVEITDEPVWVGAGPAHNVGVSVDRLPVRLTPR
jgi:cytochrome P450